MGKLLKDFIVLSSHKGNGEYGNKEAGKVAKEGPEERCFDPEPFRAVARCINRNVVNKWKREKS